MHPTGQSGMQIVGPFSERMFAPSSSVSLSRLLGGIVQSSILRSLYIYQGTLDEELCRVLKTLKEDVRMADFVYSAVGMLGLWLLEYC